MRNEELVKTEFHLHTAETSQCGKVPAREIIRLCAEAGYGGVIVTDHYLPGMFDRPQTRGLFLNGFREARAAGEALCVAVLPGMEFRFDHGGEEDFLIYGMEEADFTALPYGLCEYSLADFYAYCRGRGFLVFQAHPFRLGHAAQNPDCLDGIEVHNGNPRQINRNELALAYARANNLLTVAGGDVHQRGDVREKGLMVPRSLLTPGGIVRFLRENPGAGADYPQ